MIEVKNGDVTHHIGVISLPTFYEDFEARRRGDKDYRARRAMWRNCWPS